MSEAFHAGFHRGKKVNKEELTQIYASKPFITPKCEMSILENRRRDSRLTEGELLLLPLGAARTGNKSTLQTNGVH